MMDEILYGGSLVRHSAIARLTTTAFRLYLGLHSVVDEEGTFPGDPVFLRKEIFWGTATTLNAIVQALDCLSDFGLIQPRSDGDYDLFDITVVLASRKRGAAA